MEKIIPTTTLTKSQQGELLIFFEALISKGFRRNSVIKINKFATLSYEICILYHYFYRRLSISI